MTMHDEIHVLIDKFHRKMEKDESARNEIMPIKKTLNLDLGDEHYSMRIENAKIVDFENRLLDDADVTIISTPENMTQLIEGNLRPMKAYITKKISIKGKINDLLFLKKFF